MWTPAAVQVGGVDVRQYDMEALRNQVAVVLQKNVLFSGTILDNLRWGKEDATEEECAGRLPGRPARTSSSTASQRATTPGSSRAAPMSPAGRSSGCASPGPC